MSKKSKRYLRQAAARMLAAKTKWPKRWTPQAQRMLEDLQAELKGDGWQCKNRMDGNRQGGD